MQECPSLHSLEDTEPYAATLSPTVWELILLETMGPRLPPTSQSSYGLEMTEQEPGPACLPACFCSLFTPCTHVSR